MQFSVLASGSAANCTFVSGDSTVFLIDCGLSGRECERRIAAVGQNITDVQAVVVTHDHSDHIRGVGVLSRRYGIPIYVTERVARSLNLPAEKVRIFEAGNDFSIGEFTLRPFLIPHDANETVAFTISDGLRTLAHITDCGSITALVRAFASTVEGIVLESNHDSELLQSCTYPWAVKQRIASNYGHLSNAVAAEFLASMCHETLEVVVLAHLSEESNTPELALKLAQSQIASSAAVQVLCAKAHEPTPLLQLCGASPDISYHSYYGER